VSVKLGHGETSWRLGEGIVRRVAFSPPPLADAPRLWPQFQDLFRSDGRLNLEAAAFIDDFTAGRCDKTLVRRGASARPRRYSAWKPNSVAGELRRTGAQATPYRS